MVKYSEKVSGGGYNTYFYNIDVCKVFLAMLVICIHTTPLEDINSIASYILSGCLARMAVPCFFCFSGFLFGKYVCGNRENIIPYAFKSIKKFLCIYVSWSFLYFPIMVLEYYVNGKNLMQALFWEIKDMIFIGSYFHLWYFPALIVSILLITSLYWFKVSKKLILILSFALYIFGVLTSTYDKLIIYYIKNIQINFFNDIFQDIIGLYFDTFMTNRNGLFFGFLFCSIGFYFSEKPVVNDQYRINVLGLVISIVSLVVEGIIVRYTLNNIDANMYFSLAPISWFCIKIISYNKPIKIFKNLIMNPKFRKFNLFLYCFHPLPLLVWDVLSKLILKNANSLLRFTFVMTATLLTWELVTKLKIQKTRRIS